MQAKKSVDTTRDILLYYRCHTVCHKKYGGNRMKTFKLPDNFLMGSATAATQIEGGDKYSNWYQWSLMGKIKNGESSIVAADHYNRYMEDIDLMKKMNHQVYRMSIEWSRIEPQEGKWSREGIKHYQDEIKALKEVGIEPLVTLHHFSHPQWFEEKGQWTNKESVYYFVRFTRKVIESIGDMVSEYCTINEPNVFVNDTFMDGKYPPGKTDDLGSYFKASKNLILAHLKSYELIHKMRLENGKTDTKVGIALHIAHMETKGKSPLTKLSKNFIDYSFHQMFLNGMVDGHLTFPLGTGYPIGKGSFCDFMGINYYSRHLIHSSKNPAMLFGEVKVEEGLADEKVNDLGWEIYPEGLYQVIKKNYNKYKLPIYITENGIPDEKDKKRSLFIYDHLYQIQKLIGEGIPVERYYHWSLLDNMEWNDGYGPRFGLVEVDYNTLERKIRKSGEFYGEICKSKKVSEELLAEYL